MEIFLGGEWGTVCHRSAYSEDARVVCRQLGYNTYGNYQLCTNKILFIVRVLMTDRCIIPSKRSERANLVV